VSLRDAADDENPNKEGSMLRVRLWMMAGMLVSTLLVPPVRGAETKQEVKELDKLQGYDSLPGEKSVKKDMMKGAKLPVETIIVWSEANPNKGSAPLKVAFAADPPPDVPDAFYTWNFGDESAPTTGQSVTHTFTKPGIYKVILKVSNKAGDLGEDELRIKVMQ
jgi:hypothetical protein